MTLTTSEKHSLVYAYYKNFPKDIKDKFIVSTLYKMSEKLAVCLSHIELEQSVPCDNVQFHASYTEKAMLDFRVYSVEVRNIDVVKSQMEELGRQTASLYANSTFEEYQHDIKSLVNQGGDAEVFPIIEYANYLNHKRHAIYNQLDDELDFTAEELKELEEELDYAAEELEYDLHDESCINNFNSPEPGFESPDSAIGYGSMSGATTNNAERMNLEVAKHVTLRELRSRRLSFIKIEELIKDGDSDVQELLNNICWMIKAKFSRDDLDEKKLNAHVQVDDKLFMAAASGSVGFIRAFANTMDLKPFSLRFPQDSTELRNELAAQISERTIETSIGAVRGPSKDWFSIAESTFKRKLQFSDYVSTFLKEVLTRREDGKIQFEMEFEQELVEWAEQQNDFFQAMHESELSFRTFIIENSQANKVSSYKKAKEIKVALQEKVIGQPKAVDQVSSLLSSLVINGSKEHLGVSTFFGASGTGKTFLAEAIGEIFTKTMGLAYNVNVINMEQLTDAKDVLKIFGTGSQYVDSALGFVTLSVMKHPRSIIVFDEIEKAHPDVVQSLLTLIDKGKATDNTTNRKVDFSLCYFIFTTNIGGQQLQGKQANLDFDPVEMLTRKKLDTERTLSPEMANRLASGNIAVFKPFLGKDLVKIANSTAKKNFNKGKVQWPKNRTAELILSTLGGSATPRAISKQLDKLSGQVTDYLIEAVDLEQLDTLNKITFEDAPIWKEQNANVQVFCNIGYTALSGSDSLKILPTCTVESLEKALKSGADAIVIDDFSIDVDIALLADLIKQYPEKAVFSIRLTASTSKFEKAGFQSLLLHTYTLPLSANISDFKAVLESVEYYAFLIKSVNIAISKNVSVDYSLKNTIRDNCIEVQIGSFKETQRVRGEDAELPFLSFAGKPTGSLDDVIGLESEKNRLTLIVNTMKNKEVAKANKLTIPKGYLFTGLPGTGKTHLARSLAGECGMQFFSVNSADLLVGNPIDNINRLFEVAKRYQPSIIFLDEIDSIAKSRQLRGMSDPRVVNSLLTAMDGFNKTESDVFVLAATNNVMELDPALKRAGRFDRTVYFSLPNKIAREKAIEQWFAEKETQLDSELKTELVSMLNGETLGRINEVFNNSMITSLAKGEEWNPDTLIEEIRSASFGAVVNSSNADRKELECTAYHEAGHLIAHKLLFPDTPVEMASVQQRGDALGMVVPGQSSGSQTWSKRRVKHQLQILLAGIAAEKIIGVCGDNQTTGGTNDRSRATQLTKKAIMEWGMSDDFSFAIPSELKIEDAQLNSMIFDWLSKAFDDVMTLLEDNRAFLDEVATNLMDKELLDKIAIDNLFEAYFKKRARVS